MRESRKQSGIPLYLLMTGLVLCAVLFTTALQLLNIRRESRLVALEQASASFTMAFHSVVGDVEQSVEPILSLVNTAASQDKGVKLTSFRNALNDYLHSSLQALASRKNIFAVNYGFTNGNFFSVSALRTEKARQSYKAPENAVYAVWAVAPNAKGERREWWLFLDENFKEILLRADETTYDPREKTWYKTAMSTDELIMTTPYMFTTSRQLGMACARAMRNRGGVFSINITLENFNDMLRDATMSHSGALMLLDSQHRVIASTESEIAARTSAGELVPLQDVSFLKSNGVYDYLNERGFRASGAQFVHFGSTDCFLQFSPVPMGTQELYLLLMAPASDYAGFAEKLFMHTALFSMVAMFVCGLATLWLARWLGTSLGHLMEETQRIAASTKKFGAWVSSPIYEVNRLAKAIYTMENTITSRTEALQGMAERLEMLVDERTSELIEARERAEGANRAKSAFLATMSHEIRTPMNAIIGFIHLFDKENLSERQRNYLGKIRLSAETLLTIINDVLDFSKIEARKLVLERIPFRLQTVVDSVQSIIALVAEKKGLQLIVDVAEDVPDAVVGDPSRLHQVLLNLLSNAVKFTPQGQVTLTMVIDRDAPAASVDENSTDAPEDFCLLFTVRDTGIGISKDNLELLFEPFTQADQSITRKFGGTGLGLVICMQLLELMNGSIVVESEEGKGTSFTCRVRLGLQSSADEILTAVAEGSAERSLQEFAGSSVLVVEDNAINQEIVVTMLEQTGLVVHVAENGSSALELLEKTPVDVVLMDMQMPIMGGIEATTILRTLRDEAGTLRFPESTFPVIAMTANAMLEDKSACLQAGMNDHVAKPLNPNVLYERLAYWLAQRKKCLESAD